MAICFSRAIPLDGPCGIQRGVLSGSYKQPSFRSEVSVLVRLGFPPPAGDPNRFPSNKNGGSISNVAVVWLGVRVWEFTNLGYINRPTSFLGFLGEVPEFGYAKFRRSAKSQKVKVREVSSLFSLGDPEKVLTTEGIPGAPARFVGVGRI